MKSKYLAWLFIVLNINRISAQNHVEDRLFENIEDPDGEVMAVLEELQDEMPNLNTAPFEKMNLFPLLTESEARKIIHEREYRHFLNWSDFQKRTGLDEDLVRSMQHYFSIKAVESFASLCDGHLRERFQRKFPESSGYKTGAYAGSVWKMVHRFKFGIKKYIKAGLLIEKDPGESRWNDHQTGFIEIQLFREQIHMILGNYRVHMGQGLVIWGPYGNFKSAAPLAVLPRSGECLHEYLYADEARYLTGGGVQIRWRNWQVVSFISNTAKDASTDSTITFLNSGLHRTISERSHKHVMHEALIGGALSFNTHMGTVGCSGWKNHYHFQETPSDLAQQRLAFHNLHTSVYGWFWNLHYSVVQWNGEYAHSQSGAEACISAFVLKIRSFSWILLYRDFGARFHNPHACGFGSGEAENEQGWYCGAEIRYTRKNAVRFYSDLYRTSWCTYLIPMPASHSDLLIQTDYFFNAFFQFSGQIRFRSGPQKAVGKIQDVFPVNTLQDRIHHQYTLNWLITPAPGWQMRTRIKWVHIKYPAVQGQIHIPGSTERGFLMSQDIRFNSGSFVSWSFQWICFDTDSYDSRIYMAENDLPGILSSTMLYGQGTRWAGIIQLRPWSSMQFSVKFGLTSHDGSESWGTGTERISGDTVKELCAQLDVTF